MKKKKIILMSLIFLIIFCMIVLIPNFNFAKANIKFNISSNIDNPIANQTKDVMGTGIKVIRTVAVGVAIIMLTYIAIKYMTESAEGKANLKKSATIYVVGAVLILGTSGIISLIQKFVNNNI